jgi:CRP-like cAMP-binding protein
MPATTIDDGTRGEGEPFDYKRFGARYSGVTISKCADRQIVFAQGDPANAIFYIISGSFKVTIISEHGKEAVISILGPGDFFGEGCLDGHLLQSSTISSTTAGEIVRFDRSTILQALKDDPVFSNLFLRFILDRNQKLQADLVDQLFNSRETIGADTNDIGKRRPQRSVEHNYHTDYSGDARQHGRHNTLAHQPVHDEIPQARLHRL